MEMKALKTAMTDSISEVLETMFYLPVDMDVDDDTSGSLWDPHDRDIMASQLAFTGPFSGSFHFLIPDSMAASITGSFLGIDVADMTPVQVSETVTEIINMVAGNTFSKFDDQAIFNLDVPKVKNYKDLSIGCLNASNSIIIPVRTLEDRLIFVISFDA